MCLVVSEDLQGITASRDVLLVSLEVCPTEAVDLMEPKQAKTQSLALSATLQNGTGLIDTSESF